MLVLGLPRHQQRKTLRYGILGAFFFRILAILLATYRVAFFYARRQGAVDVPVDDGAVDLLSEKAP